MTKNRTLRVPDDLDGALRVEAAERDTSVHEYILRCLRVRPAVSGITRGPLADMQITNLARGTMDAQDTPRGRAADQRTATADGPGVPDFPSPKPLCTCGPGERAKGKHNRHCPAK